METKLKSLMVFVQKENENFGSGLSKSELPASFNENKLFNTT